MKKVNKTSILERRIARLEKLTTESLKDNAINELRDELSYWLDTNGPRRLMQLRKSIMTYSKHGAFEDLVEDIEMNDADAASYYHSVCEYDDDLYECDEFDNDVLDIVDELLGI